MQEYVGKQIDRYRILGRLGVGGMAVVYKAYDTRLERDVALKIIRSEAIPPEHLTRLMKRFTSSLWTGVRVRRTPASVT